MICPNIIFDTLKNIEIEKDIFQTIGMALLTILIPVAIAIFEDKKDFEILDKNVILDYVVKARFFLGYLALIFLPLLFWNLSPAWLRLVELISWSVGVFFIIKVLVKSYQWIKGNKFSLRIDYLKRLREPTDLEVSWRSVWETKKINLENERRFLESFFERINNLLGKDRD